MAASQPANRSGSRSRSSAMNACRNGGRVTIAGQHDEVGVGNLRAHRATLSPGWPTRPATLPRHIPGQGTDRRWTGVAAPRAGRRPAISPVQRPDRPARTRPRLPNSTRLTGENT
jgi:hypothetical protein